ncbi:hypothetical protein ACFYZE_14835 [Streptomyces sp. NPDC001796]|uniref:hypothetical protein n=1 Tax=Streptomyces sp. NPDC001796 TaxID=3364609 RepID=UPI0036B724ED
MPASERDEAQPRVVPGPRNVSMKDLLASCAAAKAVSTPPRDPAPDTHQPAPVTEDRRRAA